LERFLRHDDVLNPANALTGVAADLAAGEFRVRALFEGRSNDALNRRPRDKAWSPLQCIQHLAMANRFLGDTIDRALPTGPGRERRCEQITPVFVWRILFAMVEPQCRLKGFAPTVLRPLTTLDAGTTLAEYLESHELLRLAMRCDGRDLNRKRLRHPHSSPEDVDWL
jgi:DinB family protein